MKRSLWKLRLGAFGLGLVAAVVTFAIAIFISNDVRLIYACGVILIFSAAVWLGRKNRDWISAALVAAPLVAVFSEDALPNLPSLWPNVLLWIVAAAVGLVFFTIWQKTRGLELTLIALLLLGSIWYCGWYTPEQLAKSFNHPTDTAAPAFTLEPVGDKSLPVSPRPGKVLVIDFFSTTCAPCIAELPELVSVQQELKNDRDVQFVIAASDRGNDTPEQLRAFMQRRHIDIPLAFDPSGKVHDSFGLRGVPALVVLDREDRVRLTRAGYNPAETSFHRDLVQLIKTLE